MPTPLTNSVACHREMKAAGMRYDAFASAAHTMLRPIIRELGNSDLTLEYCGRSQPSVNAKGEWDGKPCASFILKRKRPKAWIFKEAHVGRITIQAVSHEKGGEFHLYQQRLLGETIAAHCRTNPLADPNGPQGATLPYDIRRVIAEAKANGDLKFMLGS